MINDSDHVFNAKHPFNEDSFSNQEDAIEKLDA